MNVPATTVDVALSQVMYGSSNRESNETAMKYGVIKKIDYPTGGNTAFEFEANKAITQAPAQNNLFYMSNCGSPDAAACCANSNVTS